jgi:CubicO group peptidase (beta-lactamase class C family)
MLKKILFTSYIVVLTSYICTAQTPSFIKDSLDAYISEGMKDFEVPGLAIAIIKNGQTVVMKGYGTREVGKNKPVDENTLFMIASNSKLFTGTALAKLEAEGKLSLEDKVSKHIPWFRLYDSNATNLVTIRDLMSHHFGTKTFQGDFTFWDSKLPVDSIIWKMRLLKPGGQFRKDWGYCNAGFVTAGAIIPKVTGGIRWDQYIQENIFNPLGMNNTYAFGGNIGKLENVALPYSNSWGKLTQIPFDNIDNFAPAASIVSNVKDIAKWLQMQLDTGKFEGRQIIPKSAIFKTRDINTITTSRKSAVYPSHFGGYGLGVFITEYNGRMVYWHTGGAFGYVTNTCFIPEEKLAFTILTNNDNQNFFEALRYQILDAYLGVPYTNRAEFYLGFHQQEMKETAKTLKELDEKVKAGNTTPLPLKEYAGEYYNNLYGKIAIKAEGKILKVYFSNHPDLTGTLEYMDNNEFRITYSNYAYGVFRTKFKVADNKVKSVEIKASDFVEFDPYQFTKL